MSYSIDERFNQIDEAIEELATGGTPDVLTLYLTKQEASSTYLTQSDASNDYLPLSAGVNKPLSDSLFLDLNSEYKKVEFLSNGDSVSTVSTNGTNMYVCTLNTDGTPKVGMSVEGNHIIFSSNNDYICFKPKGKDSSVPECYINSTADINFNSADGNTIRKYTSNSQMGYLYFSPTGYLDIWSNNVTQIRTGTGHQSDDTVRFIFGTTGVMTAPGMYTTTRSGSTLVIDSSGAIGRTSSLRKYKKDIMTVTDEDAIKGYDLNPITYTSALEYDLQNTQYGLIAEEVEEVLPNLCTYDTDGNIDGVAYDRVCAILLKQNQLLNERVKELENKLKKLP